MKEKLIKLIPEINLIEDEELKNKVINVFIEAIERGGWNIEEIKKIPFTLVIKNINVDLIRHIRAVTNTALEIYETFKKFYDGLLKINKDILIAGALLHDVGKFLEYSKEGNTIGKSKMGKIVRHTFSGVAIAYKYEVPEEILHIIGTHSKEGDIGKRTIESIIINHSDFLNFDIFK